MSESIIPDKDLSLTIQYANESAISHLAQKNFDQAFEVLKRTEHMLLTQTDAILKQNLKNNENLNFLSITLNNLGCYYLCKNKLNAAMKYFIKSKEIEFFSSDREVEKAVAYLNLTIAHQRMKNFKKSLEAAQAAENILVTRFTQPKMKKGISGKIKALVNENSEVVQYDQSILPILCFYYLGLAQESIEHFTEAYLSFNRGFSTFKRLSVESVLWEEKFIKKLTFLRTKLKESLPYLEDLNLKKLLQNPRFRRKEDDNKSISSIESSDFRIIKNSKEEPKVSESYKGNSKITDSAKKRPILAENSLISNKIVEVEESKEETFREGYSNQVILPKIPQIGRSNLGQGQNFIRSKRGYGLEDGPTNRSAIETTRKNGYGNPTPLQQSVNTKLNQSFNSDYHEAYRNSPNLSSSKVNESLLEKSLNNSMFERSSSNTKQRPPVSIIESATISPGIVNENFVIKSRPRSNIKTNSNKIIKLPPLPLTYANKSESGTPPGSLKGSLELPKKSDLNFLVSIASKMVKKLNIISEKLGEMKESENDVSEMLAEIDDSELFL